MLCRLFFIFAHQFLFFSRTADLRPDLYYFFCGTVLYTSLLWGRSCALTRFCLLALLLISPPLNPRFVDEAILKSVVVFLPPAPNQSQKILLLVSLVKSFRKPPRCYCPYCCPIKSHTLILFGTVRVTPVFDVSTPICVSLC